MAKAEKILNKYAFPREGMTIEAETLDEATKILLSKLTLV